MKRPMVNAITMNYFTAGPSKDSLEAGKFPRSIPNPYRATPQGYVAVDAGKGCVLLLTAQEYTQALKRGKVWRRRQARPLRTRRTT